MKCPLCGSEFDPSCKNNKKSACASCPMRGSCELLCCTNCGYEIPKESKIVNFFFSIINFLRSGKNAKS